MTDKEHTPTPWKICYFNDGLWGICGPDKQWIIRINDSDTLEDQNNCKFIVQAVNSHEESLGLIRELAESARATIEHYRIVNRPIEPHVKTAGMILLERLEKDVYRAKDHLKEKG